MYDVLNRLTGRTMTCTSDSRRAREIAAPMEHYRVIPARGTEFSHLPFRRNPWAPNPVDVEGHRLQQALVAEFIAEAESRPPEGCGCSACLRVASGPQQ